MNKSGIRSFKKAFENKLLLGYGFFCNKVSIVSIKTNSKTYKFLRLDGNNGKQNPPFDAPEEETTYFYLITKNKFLRNITQKENKKSFLSKNMNARFGTVKRTIMEIEQRSTHPDPSTCVLVELNHTKNVAELVNISVHSFCNIESMDEIMNLFNVLLKKVKWSGRIELSDNAHKNGIRVAVYYMRKHKDDPDKFSKYQDYGFNVLDANLPALRKIKNRVLKLTDEDATKKYDSKLGDLLAGMYKVAR